MKNSIFIIVILFFCFTLCYLASENTIVFLGYPLLYQVFILIFLIQFIAFLPSYSYQTEHYYDLIGGLTFISVLKKTFEFLISVPKVTALSLVLEFTAD